MGDLFSNIQRLLILQLSEDIESCEINAVTQAAENLQLGYHREPLMSATQLGTLASLCSSSQYNLVYICGHGSDRTVGDKASGGFEVTWPQLSAVLCNSLSPNASFFLSCCDGGLHSVAADLFSGCDELKYVFGVPRAALPWQLVSSFTNVLTQLRLGASPPQAAEAAAAALKPPNGHLDPDIVDFEFEAHVRDETINQAEIERARESIPMRYSSAVDPICIGEDCWQVANGDEVCGIVEINATGREELIDPAKGSVIAHRSQFV